MMSAALSYNTNPLLPNRALSNVDHPVYGDDELTLYGIVCFFIGFTYYYSLSLHYNNASSPSIGATRVWYSAAMIYTSLISHAM